MHDWPFVDDFDWAGLPSDPLPPTWVQPWSWLQDIGARRAWAEMGDYVALMEQRGLPLEFGYCPLSLGRVARLPVPWDMIVEEFAHQSVYFTHRGERYRLQAGEPTASPLTEPVAFVSGNGPGLTVAAIDGQARWTDRLRVVAVQEATAQLIHVVWEADHLQVWSREEILHEAPARITRAVRPCPIIPGARPGQLCRQYGGGWVSAAIVATGRWLDERDKRLREVGCDTCGDGAIRIPPKYGEWMVIGPTGRERESSGPTRYEHPVKWE